MVKTNSQMMKLIVCLKTNRFLIVKVVVEFSHRKSCGCFFRFGGRLGSNCKKLCLIDSIFATKKKTIPEKRFSGSKVSKFSLTNPTSSSLSDQEAVALRLAPAGRRKGVLCKMSYADS